MTKRKSKKPQEEDTSILLEMAPIKTVSQAKSQINSQYTSPAVLSIVVFTIGASVMGWFCAQQQQSLDQLSETFTTMQKRIANLQQVVEMTDAQTDSDFSVEDRMFALEEAQKQAREKAEVALATSEKLKNSDNYAQLWALHDEMDTRLTEIKQVALSITPLQAMFNNQSEEFEAVKESVVAGLSSSSTLAENVAGLTSAVLSACSRVDEQVASVEALNVQLKGHASDLNELKESMYLHKDALHTNNQEMAAIKELVEAKQAMRAQALEEMLSSVQMTLDEQYFTSQTLRSSLMTQLQMFHSQLANAPSQSLKAKSNEEGPAAEEFVSTTAQNAAEVTEEKLEDIEGQDEQQDTDDEAEEEAEEEEAMQEEQPLEEEVDGVVIEEQGEEEEEITEEEEDITPEEEEEYLTPEEEEDLTPEEEEEDLTPEEEEEDLTPEEEEEDDITPEEEEEDDITPEEEEEDDITPEEEEEDDITPEEEEEDDITPEEEEEDITPEEEEEEDITPEEEEEDLTPEEVEDEGNTEQSEEQAVAGEEEEEEVAEETVDGHVLDESLEEVVSEEVGETVVEDSGELNREVFMDGNDEDV